MTSIKVNGFNEVYQSGTEAIELTTGHYFKIATLPAIVLLKLIAFDDRPERRTKDARDIANIITHFFDLQADLIYDKHTDLFADQGDPRSLHDISCVVIGREMQGISKANLDLHHRLKRILGDHIAQGDESSFVVNMVVETKRDVEECVGWLKHMVEAMAEETKE